MAVHDQLVRDLPTKRVECDEVWSFCYAKKRNAPEGMAGAGDIWTFSGIDWDSKLVISWLVGERSYEAAYAFMRDLASRLANRVQLTTDGHHMYLSAVERAFGWNGVDFAQLVKYYTAAHGPGGRYSPPRCTGTTKERIMGTPVKADVSTSFV